MEDYRYYNKDNYDFLDIYAESKEELIRKFNEFNQALEEHSYSQEEIKKMISWEGEGKYDLVGRAFGADQIMRLEEINKHEKELYNTITDI